MTICHYDFYAQALSKIERGHARDLVDVACMERRGLIEKGRLVELFRQIEPELIRYPAIETSRFQREVLAFVGNDFSRNMQADFFDQPNVGFLPGSEIIVQGLADLRSGCETPEACLASIAWPRLIEYGWVNARNERPLKDPEHRLYRQLALQNEEPYSVYKGWLRRLARFEHALDHIAARQGLTQRTQGVKAER
jgi:hypothetical protein